VPPRNAVKVSKDELGERLRSLRHSLGITQREIARLLGVDQAHISNVERGARGLTIQQVVKLSRGLGVSADEILNNGKKQKPVNSLRDGRILLRLQRIQELPHSQQQAILKILDGLLEGRRRIQR
jgi:transcriptional regulator with XRE-family HTH domain